MGQKGAFLSLVMTIDCLPAALLPHNAQDKIIRSCVFVVFSGR